MMPRDILVIVFAALLAYFAMGLIATMLIWPFARENPPGVDDEMILLRMVTRWPWYVIITGATGLIFLAGLLTRWRMRTKKWWWKRWIS